MKKLLSLLGIVLILSTLLVTFASCGVEYYVPADNVEEQEEVIVIPNYPMTEKEKNSAYESAIRALAAEDWITAYNYFLQISDYRDVPSYLARFSYKANTTTINDVTDDPEGVKVFQIETKFTNYGYFNQETLFHIPSSTASSKKYATTSKVLQVPEDPTDPNNKKTKEDEHKRPLSISTSEHPTLFGTVPGYTTEFVYDFKEDDPKYESSLVVTERISNLRSQQFEINYKYNENKVLQQTNITWTNEGTPYDYEFVYIYDAAGKLTKVTFVNNKVEGMVACDYAIYTYNAAGQLTSVTYPGGPIDPVDTLSLSKTNKPADWIIPTWNAENAYTVTYEYNELGQLSKEVLNYANSDDKDQTITYDIYNEDGVLLQKTLTMKVKEAVTNEAGESEEVLTTKVYRYSVVEFSLYYDPLA